MWCILWPLAAWLNMLRQMYADIVCKTFSGLKARQRECYSIWWMLSFRLHVILCHWIANFLLTPAPLHANAAPVLHFLELQCKEEPFTRRVRLVHIALRVCRRAKECGSRCYEDITRSEWGVSVGRSRMQQLFPNYLKCLSNADKTITV